MGNRLTHLAGTPPVDNQDKVEKSHTHDFNFDNVT